MPNLWVWQDIILGSVAIFGNLTRIWLLLTPICCRNFLLATWYFWLLFDYFWKFGKKLVLKQFKTSFGLISLCFDVDIFAFGGFLKFGYFLRNFLATLILGSTAFLNQNKTANITKLLTILLFDKTAHEIGEQNKTVKLKI